MMVLLVNQSIVVLDAHLNATAAAAALICSRALLEMI